MSELMNILAAWITFFSLVVFFISIVAYSRVKSLRILLVSLAFLIFFIKGLLLTGSLMNEYIQGIYGVSAVALDTMIIILFSYSVLKK